MLAPAGLLACPAQWFERTVVRSGAPCRSDLWVVWRFSVWSYQSDRYGVAPSGAILARIDDYYTDQHGEGRGVAAQVARQLADPRPRDVSVTRQLASYRHLDTRWTDWRRVRAACHELAAAMLDQEG